MYDFVINKLKEIQIELLNEIDRICKKHNIKYQLFAGSLLGAVRHEGFIPWDDDIDICMLRNDYENFINLAKQELNNKYYLQLPEEKNNIFSYAKLRKNNTEMIEKEIEHKNIHHGIFVDIFQMDNVFPKTIKGMIHKIKLNWVYTLRSTKRNIYHKNIVIRNIKRILNFIHRKNYNYYVKKINSIAMKYNKEKAKYVAHLTCGKINRNYNGFIYHIDDFNNSIYLEFEGKKYPAPRRYHELLTMQYGDYMTPPPLEKQKPHHNVIRISFGDKSYGIHEEDGQLKAKRA